MRLLAFAIAQLPRPWNIPASTRIRALPTVSRGFEPVTTPAAPWNASFTESSIGGVYDAVTDDSKWQIPDSKIRDRSF
jgi:hypothetical protein